MVVSRRAYVVVENRISDLQLLSFGGCADENNVAVRVDVDVEDDRVVLRHVCASMLRKVYCMRCELLVERWVVIKK